MISSPVADILSAPSASAQRPYVGFKVRAGAWIVVPRSGRIPRDGLAIYNPQKPLGMLIKALVQRGLWLPPSVHFEDGAVTELESMLAPLLGRKSVSCAFYFRSPGLYSKTILLVLDENGGALAYAKLGATPESKAAVAHEGDVLERLARIPALAGHVPRVIARAAWREFPMLLVSVGPSRRMSRRFGDAHRKFLSGLAASTTAFRPLRKSLMWTRMTERFMTCEAQLEPALSNRYGWALGEIERRLGEGRLALCLAHRDFVPWNMQRGETGELFVFDWELAQDQCVRGWDFFHFHLASGAMRSRRFGHRAAASLLDAAERDGVSPADGCLLAYLTDVGLFLRDRLLRSPAKQENRYLHLVENAIDSFRRKKAREPVVRAMPVAGTCR